MNIINKYSTFLLCFLLTLTIGCSRPQVGHNNQRIVASLRTALSTRKAEWLEQNETLIEKKHNDGLISKEAYDALKAIVDKAKEGNWDEAEQEVIALQRSQRPQPKR